jgi:hypothetical protein
MTTESEFMWYSSIKERLFNVKYFPHGTGKQNQELLLEKISDHNSKVSMKTQIKFRNYEINFKAGMNKGKQTKTSKGKPPENAGINQFVE